MKEININSKEFAEFYGIMLGDGCIYSNLSGICISGHITLDEKYHKEKIGKLISHLFDIKPKFYYSKDQKLLRTVIYSKEIVLFLKELGFPVGFKKNNIILPRHFYNNKKLLKSLIRGLYDTDGTIYPHPGAKAIIEISIKDLGLLEITKKIIDILDLDLKSTKDRVYLSGREKVIKFYEEIEPKNQRHTIKYNFLLKGEKIPTSKEIESFLKTQKFKLSINGPVV